MSSEHCTANQYQFALFRLHLPYVCCRRRFSMGSGTPIRMCACRVRCSVRAERGLDAGRPQYPALATLKPWMTRNEAKELPEICAWVANCSGCLAIVIVMRQYGWTIISLTRRRPRWFTPHVFLLTLLSPCSCLYFILSLLLITSITSVSRPQSCDIRSLSLL